MFGYDAEIWIVVLLLVPTCGLLGACLWMGGQLFYWWMGDTLQEWKRNLPDWKRGMSAEMDSPEFNIMVTVFLVGLSVFILNVLQP